MMDYRTAKKRKDILQPLFSRKAIEELQHLVQQKVRSYFSYSPRSKQTKCMNQTQADGMCDNMQRLIPAGKPIDIYKAFRCFAVDGITSFCFGTSQEATEAPDFEAPLVEAMHASMSEVHKLLRFPFLKKFIENSPDRLICFLEPQMEGLTILRAVRYTHSSTSMLLTP